MFFKPILNYINNIFFKPILNYIINNNIIYFQKTRHNEFISDEGYSILSDSSELPNL